MRTAKPYVQIDPAAIEQARQMDLLSYLQRYEPSNPILDADGVILEGSKYHNAIFVDKCTTENYQVSLKIYS